MKISPTLRSKISKSAAKTVKKFTGKTGAFTLIELLVVIAIIAVLAGLLFPAMGAVRTAARKTSAKNDVVQIVNGVKNFYVEYGRYPVPSDTTDEKADNQALFTVLRAVTTSALNPRKIRFLEVPDAKNGKSGILSSGTPPTGVGPWVDPWGNPYVIYIDVDYGDSVSVSGLSKSKNNYKDGIVQTGVAAFSTGKPSNESTSAEFNDPVGSW